MQVGGAYSVAVASGGCALEELQKDRGVEPTGTVDAATITAFNEALATAQATPKPSPTPEASAPAEPSDDPSPTDSASS